MNIRIVGVFASVVVTLMGFWQSDLSGTRGDTPIRLGADGHLRSHNRHLADVVCGKDPSPW